MAITGAVAGTVAGAGTDTFVVVACGRNGLATTPVLIVVSTADSSGFVTVLTGGLNPADSSFKIKLSVNLLI